MKAFALVAVAFALGCGHTQVQTTAEEPKVVKEVRKEPAATSEPEVVGPSSERLNQCIDGVAAQYNVPTEPETAAAIIEGMLKGDQSPATQEKRLMSAGLTGTDNEKIFCMVWDLRAPGDELDYGTCRHVTLSNDQKVTIQGYPYIYLVDVNGQAKGNVGEMHIFLDSDADGDVCNVVLVKPGASKP